MIQGFGKTNEKTIIRMKFLTVRGLLQKLTCCVLTCFGLIPGHVLSDTMEITGTIRSTMHSSGGSVTHDLDIPFRCHISEAMWEIEIVFERYTETATYDGRYLYWVYRGTDGGSSVAWVSENEMPFHMISVGKALWLAFAQKSELRIGDYFPSIVFDDISNPFSQILEVSKVSHNRIGNKLFLLNLEAAVSSNLKKRLDVNPYLSHSVSQKDLISVSENVRDSGIIGRVQVKYEVIEELSYQGGNYPGRFRLDVFRFNERKNDLRQRFAGNVTSVKSIDRADYIPKIDRHLTVTDYRFNDEASQIDNIRYVITNAVWRTKEDPDLLEFFERQKFVNIAGMEHQKESRMWTRIFLVFCGVTFWLLVYRWRKSRKDRTSSRLEQS